MRTSLGSSSGAGWRRCIIGEVLEVKSGRHTLSLPERKEKESRRSNLAGVPLPLPSPHD